MWRLPDTAIAFQPECPLFMYFASKPGSRSLIAILQPKAVRAIHDHRFCFRPLVDARDIAEFRLFDWPWPWNFSRVFVAQQALAARWIVYSVDPLEPGARLQCREFGAVVGVAQSESRP